MVQLTEIIAGRIAVREVGEKISQKTIFTPKAHVLVVKGEMVHLLNFSNEPSPGAILIGPKIIGEWIKG
jgi:hypothetical protein